jgi:uncharacterized protein with HEPN domain
MRQDEKDVVLLNHMRDYALKAVGFISGKKRIDLDKNEMLALAVIHLIEILGEASNSLSEELKNRYPEVPWGQISGTRNRLAHGYIDVDLDIIWTIVTRDLPALIQKLQIIIEKES